MSAIVRFPPALAAALLLAFAPGLEAQQRDSWSWSRALPAGQTIEIRGINGEVRAGPAPAGEVRVSAEKRSQRSNLGDVTIEVVEHAGGVTICAVYPTPRSVRNQNRCTPGGDGDMSVQNNDVVVDFTVQVPAGVHLVGRTVNGGIDARELTGDVDARTVNGGVTVATAGRARGATVNGSVDISMGRVDQAVKLETVNGQITLRLPAGANANVRAATVNGDISTDFPLSVQGRFGRRSLDGSIGSGGRLLELTTVNGSIAIRRQ
jgi:hypothetical protein